jgi:hypothetical protein
MIDRIDRVSESASRDGENLFQNVLLAITSIRHALSNKRIIIEQYRLDDFSLTAYMPFMNFLQNRDYETVRRFVLIHNEPVSGGQWDVAANGVVALWKSINLRLRFTLHSSSTRSS